MKPHPSAVGLTLMLVAMQLSAQNREIKVPRQPNGKIKPGHYVVSTNGALEYYEGSPEQFWPGTWKEGTNGLRVQVQCLSSNSNPLIWVSLGSVKTNSWSLYVGPPAGKLKSLELRSPEGKVLPPIKRGAVVRDYAREISVRDLPRLRDGTIRDQIGFFSNSPPATLVEFSLRDVFRVEKEGDYTLTVSPVVYRFEQGDQKLVLVELPSVEVNLHLRPVEDE